MTFSAPVRPPAGRARIARATARWSRRLVVGLVAVGVLGPAGASWPSSVVLAVAATGFLAGIPHGAVDHVLLSRLTGRGLGGVTAVYAACAVATWALLRWGGPVPLVAVVLLSVVHFGLGELEAQPGARGPVAAVATAVAATGALLLPLARSGAEIRAVAAALSPGLGAVVGSDGFRLATTVTWLVAAGVAGVAAVRAGRPVVLLDLVLVGALGALLPPLVAFAVWFGGWHALRHAGRLLVAEPGCATLVDAGRTRDAVLRLARMAALPTVAALATLVVIAALTVTATDGAGSVAEALRVLLALTVPHMLVVLWIDVRSHGA
ncbi:MAG: beta-carotene 15,15'-dioxygenase, Brp/Blh family [Pseudonocardia sp.]|uniref:beta-carotene 15,15'-dioxygenase, Brp/Blh family n=1 Tax=Pseudonocardia sp. TaxID=60912 RepID=UPI001AC6967C|nr:beta-carotene 15,15'-dioxygenase, Brp/Blh family [Pseudonocardia sp.]MBN9103318.1 beta-carotene 15,15'-dioxygenase, Brp/Blh family [Pseudonocardia sp.]